MRGNALFKEILKEVRDCRFNKVLVAIFLFDFMDRLRKMQFPKNWLDIFEKEINELGRSLRHMDRFFEFSNNGGELASQERQVKSIPKRTGEVYYNLWKNFTEIEYHFETIRILKERFEKNNISVADIKCALDNGCGSGRYAYGLKKLGCAKVWGVDVSLNSIAFAQKNNSFQNDEVQFLTGSALELPFKNEQFDFVFSNGVLHHTVDTKKGLSEINRVLKKGGKCWLYLYGGKNSFFWDVVDFCRKILESVPQKYTQTVMNILGYSPGRIFHRSDFFYVPINNRYCEKEIVIMLNEAGFNNYRRLKRGVANDWDEIIYNNPDIDPYIYGEGEMRFLIEK